MARGRLTEAQREMLDCVRTWDGESWGEIDVQFLSRRRIPQYPEAATAKQVADALIRKGYIHDDGDGRVSITNAGREALVPST